MPQQPYDVHRFLADVLFGYAFASAEGAGAGRATRQNAKEAQADQQAMSRQILARIHEMAREARTMADVPGWLLDLAAQLGVEG